MRDGQLFVILFHNLTPERAEKIKSIDEYDVVSTDSGTVYFTGTGQECQNWVNEYNEQAVNPSKQIERWEF